MAGSVHKDLADIRFDRLRIPVRCPHCATIHNFYYAWLRSAGGFQCPNCRLAVMMELEDVDAAMEAIGAAVDALSRAVGRLALQAWKPDAAHPEAAKTGSRIPQPHPSPPSPWERGG